MPEHELSKIIIDARLGRLNRCFAEPRLDELITSWLKEKGEEYKIGSRKFDDVFGLLEPKKEEILMKHFKEELEPMYGFKTSQSKPQPSGEKWCPHFLKIGETWKLFQTHEIDELKEAGTSEWKFCPICSAPRPVKKRLAEILRKASFMYQEKVTTSPSFTYMAKHESEAVAKAAEDYFIGAIDSVMAQYPHAQSYVPAKQVVDELKRRLT